MINFPRLFYCSIASIYILGTSTLKSWEILEHPTVIKPVGYLAAFVGPLRVISETLVILDR